MKELTQQQKDNLAALEAAYRGEPWQWQDTHGEWIPARSSNIHDTLLRGFDCRPKPPIVTRPWSKPDDVPGPVCWITNEYAKNNGVSYMVVGIVSGGVYIAISRNTIIPWHELAALWQYSTDRKTWHPCTVTEGAE